MTYNNPVPLYLQLTALREDAEKKVVAVLNRLKAEEAKETPNEKALAAINAEILYHTNMLEGLNKTVAQARGEYETILSAQVRTTRAPAEDEDERVTTRADPLIVQGVITIGGGIAAFVVQTWHRMHPYQPMPPVDGAFRGYERIRQEYNQLCDTWQRKHSQNEPKRP